MPLLDITASNAASTGVSSPFDNNGYLIVGSNPYVGAAGGSLGPSSASPTATASTNSPGAASYPGYGELSGSGSLTGTLGSLLNNTTFWLAAGALVTLLVVLRKKKG